ncbi:MAG: RagB/SusD family nutrient uptake outer membrane protein [Bacteroidales bacterium]|nr:RagB/SusD family nutrient uptake outer membrane protein [Bacteroidales bacterium]
MRKTIYISLLLMAAGLASCNQKLLDFSPTDSGSGEELLKEASTAISSVNGIYRSMWTAGWTTTSNTHQCFGISAYNLALEVMADDLIMQGQGNGWFWFDHVYSVKSYYSSSAFRGYDVWYANYKWIADANYIIDAQASMGGTEADVAYVVGQAYAIRALAYFNLATWFARSPYNALSGTYRWNDPGVPVYTEGTSISTTGKPRENLRSVYDRIDEDIDKAVELLEKGLANALAQDNKSHINLYVALGLKSRICLAEGDWEGAYEAAMRVIEDGLYSVGGQSELMGGMNDISNANVMWGAGIANSEQSGAYAGFFTHMDNVSGAYAQAAPKLINRQLYNHISENDIRRAWWNPDDVQSPYVSSKFAFSNVAAWLGDYIYMRVEEMHFTAAEAALRSGNEEAARELMNTVMAPRNPAYNASDYRGLMLGATTTTWTGSFLENILIQRRVELWGEYGRLMDVRRLGQGISRSTEDGFSSDCITTMSRNRINITNPDTYDWVLMIPKDELDANPNINEEDQNP